MNFAGYSNLVVKLPNQGQKSAALDDLSLFVSGHLSKLINPFAEGELTHFDFWHSGSLNGESGDGDFVLERFYNDADLTDDATLRLGKMLSPVGEWNQIHAAPLVPTTVRPAVTYRNFSEYATGMSLLYQEPGTYRPEIQVYWQPSGELAERPSDVTVHQYRDVGGAHVDFPIGLLDKVGASFQRATDIHGVAQTLVGADYHYTVGKLTFGGEGTVAHISDHPAGLARDNEWGAYTSASYAVTDRWSLYTWYEGFADRAATSTAHDFLFGVTYRPHPSIVFKLEYLQNVGGQSVNPSGLFASWAVLF